MADFIINDEGIINSHGFRLLNAGVRLDRYNKNPIVLNQHDSRSPIGVGRNIRIEGERMIFTADFDLEDAKAAEVARKVEKGHLKGCSPGIIVHKMEAELLPDGSERYNATAWELCEISIVSVPSNAGAVRLYNHDMQELSAEEITKLYINQENITMQETTLRITEEARMLLDLPDCEIKDGQELSAAVLELSSRLRAAEQTVAKNLELQAASLIDEAIKEGKISATARESFLQLAAQQYELCRDTLAAIPARTSLSAQIVKSPSPTREAWKYLDWAKKDPDGLAKMKQEDPAAFDELRRSR